MDEQEIENRIMDELEGTHPSELEKEELFKVIDLTDEQIKEKEFQKQIALDLQYASQNAFDKNITPIAAKAMQVIYNETGMPFRVPSDNAIEQLPHENIHEFIEMSQESILQTVSTQLAYLKAKKYFILDLAKESDQEATPVPEEGQDPQENTLENKEEKVDEEISKAEQENKNAIDQSQEVTEQAQEQENQSEQLQETQEELPDQEPSEGELEEHSQQDLEEENVKITLENLYKKSLYKAALTASDSVSQQLILCCINKQAQRQGIYLDQAQISAESALMKSRNTLVDIINQLM